MRQYVLWPFMCLFVLFLSGCANIGNKQFFETNASTISAKKDVTIKADGMASVFVVRQKIPLQDFSYLPIPALAVGIDKRVIGWFPAGTYAHFFLTPGKHTLTGSNFLKTETGFAALTKRTRIYSEVDFDFEANKTYFISFRNEFLSPPSFYPMDAKEGAEYVNRYDYVKLYHQPVTFERMEQLVQQPPTATAKPTNSGTNAGSTNTATTPVSSAISSADVADFFATVGAVALIALAIFGMGMSSAQGPSTLTLPAPPSSSYSAPASRQSTPVPTSIRSSSGRVMMIDDKPESSTINNLSTGVQYKVQGNNITGTDGSHYRAAGSTIFSDSGNYYTRTGNVITSNDGRECQIAGTIVICR